MRSREIENGDDSRLVQALNRHAVPFESISDLSPIVQKLASARVVMLGEATHGTQEFYDWRRLISQELIAHHGFRFIAVEGDWPPCRRLNDFTHGTPGDARTALASFRRWPTWMWANTSVLELADWLRSHNDSMPPDRRVGFHGLDVYSLFESIDDSLEQVRRISPFLERRLRLRFACFDRFSRDEKEYARSLIHFPAGCREEVSKNLKEALELRLADEDRLFDLQQNLRIVANAENYYRTMVLGDDHSWNLREQHMFETLGLLLDRYGAGSKAIIWAHNTHVGDYRATNMARHGQVNLGGMVREALGENHVALLGFGSYEGNVIASHAWGGPVERMPLPKGKPGSYEAAFHKVAVAQGTPSLFLDLGAHPHADSAFAEMRGHRAVGVVYQPRFDSFGNYVPTSLARRYDAFLYLDQTGALSPLEQGFDQGDFPETWPQGM